MASSTRECNLLTEFLSTLDREAQPGNRGRSMMMRKLRLYLWWKRQAQKQGDKQIPMPDSNRQTMEGFDRIFAEQDTISDALKKKDKEKAARAQSRRRVRGGGPAAGSSIPKPEPKEPTLYPIQNEANEIQRLYVYRNLSKSAR